MKPFLLFIPLLMLVTGVQAASQNLGKELHMKNCTSCHDSSVYTRANRRVQSLPKLGSQVRLCKNNLGITWFDDEVEAVTHFLNQEYYQFK